MSVLLEVRDLTAAFGRRLPAVRGVPVHRRGDGQRGGLIGESGSQDGWSQGPARPPARERPRHRLSACAATSWWPLDRERPACAATS